MSDAERTHANRGKPSLTADVRRHAKPIETEATLVVVADSPEQVADAVAALTELDGYSLLPAKARVAELEKLQEQQQQLISLKDSELAAAQQRLADARKAAPATVATPPAPAPAEDKPAAAMGPWLWSGLGVLVLGLLAWLFLHGRRRATPAPQRRYDTAALAAGMPKAEDDAIAPAAVDSVVLAERAEAGIADGSTDAIAAEPMPAAPPTWHSARNGAKAGRETAATVAAVAPVATQAPEPRNAHQQIELARAYLDLGDDDAARALLREVMDGRDPAARSEAARMLREL